MLIVPEGESAVLGEEAGDKKKRGERQGCVSGAPEGIAREGEARAGPSITAAQSCMGLGVLGLVTLDWEQGGRLLAS